MAAESAARHDTPLTLRWSSLFIGSDVDWPRTMPVFVTASAEVRAQRRWPELGGKAAPEAYETEMIDRDDRDMNRADAPLKSAADAVRIDTSDILIERAAALDQIARRLPG